MSVIEFVEKALDIKLSEWQREFVIRCYEAKKQGKELIAYQARAGRTQLYHMENLIMLCVMLERGITNSDNLKEAIDDISTS